MMASSSASSSDLSVHLHGRHVPTCAYAFDSLELQGRDLRDQALQSLLARAKRDLLRFSESFPDADALLAECSRRGLEGIVAKAQGCTCRSDTRSGWVRVKTSEWSADNRWRGEFFDKR